ncbi:putative cytochrome C biogenesis protein ResB [Pilimelia anulata]|uniref:Putative cytochrome C biogenesis protein ResB n=1 Tax=Pilimelia anulata TaxID=53371 RepID=A0A8J3FD82_9ACTN|nr:putative cytochrome C biogenesis protein ResB [Pilimelia anulata]
MIPFLRHTWRQLTSMRTALILLFLLALAAVPGSLLPQKSVKIEDVEGFARRNPDAARWLDRVWGFEVFTSPWFAAIYLLLFASLVGCILPRAAEHWRALRAAPPAVPRHLDRLAAHAAPADVPGAPADVADRLRRALRRGRWRVAVRPGDDGSVGVSAEKGYLKETGNLLFHTALIAVLAGVAVGSWYGWHGNRLLVVGPDHAFCDTVQQYDEFARGPRVDPAALPPFCVELTGFTARYHDTGLPATFRATLAVDGDGGPRREERVAVNDPLRLRGANVYLLGHGFAPVLRYTDRYGRAQTTAAPFLPIDDNSTGEGAAKFPDANVDPRTGARDPRLQVAFEGLFLPTVPEQPPFVRSAFPEERAPGVMLWAYRGNLGEDAGIPGSVYRLDKKVVANGGLKQVGEPKLLRRGEAWTLDDGSRVEFLGSRRWVTVSVRHDPGQVPVLVGVGVVLVGLMGSLFGRRRRVFLRVTPGAGGSRVEAGGLPRTDYPGFADEFAQVVAGAVGSPDPGRGGRGGAD